MRRVKLFTIDALPYRQPIPVYGYRFGSRKKTLAVMGAIRGDEVQQMYVAARLVRKFSELEKEGAFAPDCGVMVVPCAGQFSMNVSKRFWPLDNMERGKPPSVWQTEFLRRCRDISGVSIWPAFICRGTLFPMCGLWTRVTSPMKRGWISDCRT